MGQFREIKNLQNFTAVHASIGNQFSHQRERSRRDICKEDPGQGRGRVASACSLRILDRRFDRSDPVSMTTPLSSLQELSLDYGLASEIRSTNAQCIFTILSNVFSKSPPLSESAL